MTYDLADIRRKLETGADIGHETLKAAFLRATAVDPITDYWIKHYAPKAHCGLCGNSGVIDSTGVRTPAGFDFGGRFWCICPNGQAWRTQLGGNGPKNP